MKLFSKAAAKPSETPRTPGFAPMRMAQALFTKQVKLKRDEQGYKFTLEKTAPKSVSGNVPRPLAVVISLPETAPAQTAASCLFELMDSAPGSRNAFRHLASIEHALKTKDADALFLFDLSSVHLKQALRQLDGLWMEPAPQKLAQLRAQMAHALAAQEQRDLEAAPTRDGASHGDFSTLSSFLVDEKMQVSEGRASDFHQLSASWGAPAGSLSKP